MKRALPLLLLMAACCGTNLGWAEEAELKSMNRPEDEKVLRASADEFAKAFNKHDAKTIAAQFAEEGEMIDQNGEVHHGREAIEKAFETEFKENEDCEIAVQIDSLRFLGDDLCIEDGQIVVSTGEDKPECRSKYTVVHTREKGEWHVASARDSKVAVEPSPHEQLQQLAWMLGEWIDEGEDSVVKTSCHWDESQNYLLREYSVHHGGETVLSGSQRIGWDPQSKQLKTWNFDSEGGEGTGLWEHDGNRWILKLTGISSTGVSGSATQIFTVVNDHKITWEACHRSLAGESLPDIKGITMVRSAPAARVSAKEER